MDNTHEKYSRTHTIRNNLGGLFIISASFLYVRLEHASGAPRLLSLEPFSPPSLLEWKKTPGGQLNQPLSHLLRVTTKCGPARSNERSNQLRAVSARGNDHPHQFG